MSIQKRIKDDLSQAIKDKNEEKKNTIRIIMGEFSRGAKKELSDPEVVSILRKLIKSEKETLHLKGIDKNNNYINLLETYIPKQASDDDIIQWIKNNIDFSKYKNKMQAMKDVMGHFGTTVDGNKVKDILQNI